MVSSTRLTGRTSNTLHLEIRGSWQTVRSGALGGRAGDMTLRVPAQGGSLVGILRGVRGEVCSGVVIGAVRHFLVSVIKLTIRQV